MSTPFRRLPMANRHYRFIRSRNRLLGRNVTICLLVMIIEAPVLGLRPRRGDLSRTANAPNWTSFTDSPATRAFFIVAKTVSTISAAPRSGTPVWSRPAASGASPTMVGGSVIRPSFWSSKTSFAEYCLFTVLEEKHHTRHR